MATNGITESTHLDLWTALLNGLVDQQVANDPDGDRWIRLIPEAVAMFLTHVGGAAATRTPRTKPRTTKPATKGVQR